MFYKNLFFLTLFFLSACGFSPMHRLSDNRQTSSLTEQIGIAGIPNYEGWLLRQNLQDNLNPEKTGGSKKYLLVVNLRAPTYTDQSIQGDNFASRETVRISASYTLKETETGKVILQDSTAATGAYNIVKEPYATNVARNRLREDLVKIIGDNISLRVISFMKSNEEKRESEAVSN